MTPDATDTLRQTALIRVAELTILAAHLDDLTKSLTAARTAGQFSSADGAILHGADVAAHAADVIRQLLEDVNAD